MPRRRVSAAIKATRKKEANKKRHAENAINQALDLVPTPPKQTKRVGNKLTTTMDFEKSISESNDDNEMCRDKADITRSCGSACKELSVPSTSNNTAFAVIGHDDSVPQHHCEKEENLVDNPVTENPINSIMASTHQGNRILFGKAAGKQCMPSCYISIAYSQFIESCGDWTGSTITENIGRGSSMYKHEIKLPRGEVLCAVDNLPDSITIGKQTIKRLRMSDVGGCIESLTQNDEEKVQNVYTNITSLFQDMYVGGILCTMGDYTVAIIRSDNELYVLDTHSRDITGKPCPNGVAGLFKYANAYSLASYIVKQSALLTNKPEVQYELCAVSFTLVNTSHPVVLQNDQFPAATLTNVKVEKMDLVSQSYAQVVSKSVVITTPKTIKTEPVLPVDVVSDRTAVESDCQIQETPKRNIVRRNLYKDNPEYRENQKARSSLRYQSKKAEIRAKLSNRYANNEEYREQQKTYQTQRYESDALYREQQKTYQTQRYESDALYRKKHISNQKEYQNNRYNNEENFKYDQRKVSATAYTNLLKARSEIDAATNEFRLKAQEGPTFVCTVCQRLLFKKQVKGFNSSNYEDENHAQQCSTKEYTHLSCSNVICHQTCNGQDYICFTCDSHLQRGKVPPQAIVNNMGLEKQNATFSTLNSLEQQLIALCLPFEKLITLPRSFQKKIQGPVICVPSSLETVTNVLPRPIGHSKITAIKLKRKLIYKGHVDYQQIDSVKLSAAINELKVVNPIYADVEINENWSEPSLNAQHGLETLIDADDRLTDQSDDEPCDIDIQTQTTSSHSEEADFIQGNVMDTSLQPIDIDLSSQEIDNISIAPAEGNIPISILHEANVEAKAFPALFPSSKNTYDTPREVTTTRSKYFNARVFSVDPRFARNAQYIFFAQYVKEYEALLSQISISLRKDDFARRIDRRTLLDNNRMQPIFKSDQGFRYFQSIRGSPAYWEKTMNELLALLHNIGLPTFFLTLTSAELSRWTCHLGAILRQQGHHLSDEEILGMEYKKKCEVLKSNPVTAVRMFYHRVELFFKLILKGPSQPLGKIVDYFYRVEFQARGAPHIHALLWIENAPKFDIDSDDEFCRFIDKYVVTTLPDKDEDPELYDIVTHVQMHSKTHSPSCKKGKAKKVCRFNFPKPVSDKTFIVRPERDDKSKTDKSEKYLKILQQLLQSGEMSNSNSAIYAQCGFSGFEDFQESLRLVAKKPSIIMRRNAEDVWVNNYNPDVLRAWNANIDLQGITDPYSCLMYIVSYIAKSETELGVILKQTRDDLVNQGHDINSRRAMRALAKKYTTHREVSVQEAVVRLQSMKLIEFSREVVFIPANKENTKMSKPLSIIAKQSENDSIWMTTFQDRYLCRPDSEKFEVMCQAQLFSEYRVLANLEAEKCKNSPNFIALKNNTGAMMKRTKSPPAAIRFTRFSVTNSPEKYYFSMLCLFLPHRTVAQLLPPQYASHEDFFCNGAVALTDDGQIKKVSDIVTENSRPFNRSSKELDNAFDLLQHNDSDLTDAWSVIAPETETDRGNQIIEGRELDDTGDVLPDDIPGFEDTSSEPRSNVNNSGNLGLSSIELVSDSMRPLLRSMNKKQQQIFYHVRNWCIKKKQGIDVEPFHIFVTGGAGVGKSHLIKCVYNMAHRLLRNSESPDNATVLLLAPTGTAAHNIGGHTIHSALRFPRDLNNFSKCGRLKADTLNTFRSSLEDVQIVIIDEFSMVSPVMLNMVDERLRQLKGYRSDDESADFGNISIIAVGDFYQLPPVGAHSLVLPAAFPAGALFTELFKKVELDEIMRQRDDALFARVLNRLRVKAKDDDLDPEAENLLINRVNVPDEPADALHIFATNSKADEHNKKRIHQVCSEIHTIRAHDFQRVSGEKRIISSSSKVKSILPSVLTLGIGCRAMLTKNLDVEHGLVNGVFGTVVGLHKIADSSDIETVFVLFDSERVGQGLSNKIPQGLPARAIPVKKVDESLNGPGGKSLNRIQFPLKLGFAATVHKTQGMTLDKVVYDMTGTFSAGMAYVALSRATKIEGLFLRCVESNLIYRHNGIHENLKQINDLQFAVDDCRTVEIVLHNVQGLRSKVQDIKATYATRCQVLCVTETYLNELNDSFTLEQFGNVVFRSDRKDSSGSGGSAIFCKNLIHIQEITVPRFDSIEVCMCVLSLNSKRIVLACCYRSGTVSNEYSVTCISKCVQIAENQTDIDLIIFVGDYNERLLHEGNHVISSYMLSHDYQQCVTEPTHICGGLLDAVYTKGNRVIAEVGSVYFSDHEPVFIRII